MQDFPLYLHIISFILDLLFTFISREQQLQVIGEGQMAPVGSRKQASQGSQDLPFHPEVATKVTETSLWVICTHTPSLLLSNSLLM